MARGNKGVRLLEDDEGFCLRIVFEIAPLDVASCDVRENNKIFVAFVNENGEMGGVDCAFVCRNEGSEGVFAHKGENFFAVSFAIVNWNVHSLDLNFGER